MNNRRIYWGALFTFFAIIVFVQQVDAQVESKNTMSLSSFYVGCGTGVSTFGNSFGINTTMLFSNGWGETIGIENHRKDADDIPSNANSTDKPFYDNLDNYTFRVVKMFPTQTKYVRFGTEAGVSIVNYKTTTFCLNEEYLEMESLYQPSETSKTSVGLSLRAKAEFPITKYVGLEVATSANINTFESYAGVDIYLNFGYIR